MNDTSSSHVPMPSVELNVSRFAVSFLARLLQGVAAFLPMLAAATRSTATDAQANAGICVAAVLCGVAVKTGAERWLAGRLNISVGCFTTGIFTILGAAWISLSPAVEFLPLPALLIGVAISTQWSSVAESARRCLPTTLRWRGMLLWSAAFPIGAATSIGLLLFYREISLLCYVTIGLAIVLLTLLRLAKPLEMIRDTSPPLPVEAPPPAPPVDSASVSDDESGECDATECCGGGIREIVPTSFRHGVAVFSVGILSFYVTCWYVLADVFSGFLPGAHFPGVIAFAVGLPLGTALIISAATRIGYVVALLPFLLSGAALPWLFPSSGGRGVLQVGWLFGFGVFASGVSVGLSAIIGELFKDCPSDPRRSRIVVVAVFSAAAVMAVLSLLQMAQVPQVFNRTCLSVIFVLGLLSIRILPNPVISTLGSDDESNPDDEELKDVLASIKK